MVEKSQGDTQEIPYEEIRNQFQGEWVETRITQFGRSRPTMGIILYHGSEEEAMKALEDEKRNNPRSKVGFFFSPLPESA